MHSLSKEVISSKTCVGLLHRGPYHEIGDTFRKFYSLFPGGAGGYGVSKIDGKTLGLYLDDPQITKPEDLRSYAAMDITDQDPTFVDTILETIHVSGGTAAVMTVLGSYSQLGEAWQSLGQRIASQGWKPSSKPDCISQEVYVVLDKKDESKNITKLIMFLEEE